MLKRKFSYNLSDCWASSRSWTDEKDKFLCILNITFGMFYFSSFYLFQSLTIYYHISLILSLHQTSCTAVIVVKNQFGNVTHHWNHKIGNTGMGSGLWLVNHLQTTKMLGIQGQGPKIVSKMIHILHFFFCVYELHIGRMLDYLICGRK